MQDADGESIIFTPEAEDIHFWARFQSWTFCDGCGKLEPRKLLPSFRHRNPSPLTRSCKCSTAIYKVPVVDDIPLILRNLTEDDLRVLRPLTIHCGDYERRFNGYRQRTGPFHVNWSEQPVHEKIANTEDPRRRAKLTAVLDFLVQKNDSSYAKFIAMHLRGYRRPYLYEIFSSKDLSASSVLCGHLCILPQRCERACWRARQIEQVARYHLCTRSSPPFPTTASVMNSSSTSMIAGSLKP